MLEPESGAESFPPGTTIKSYHIDPDSNNPAGAAMRQGSKGIAARNING